MVFNASSVFLQVNSDSHGKLLMGKPLGMITDVCLPTSISKPLKASCGFTLLFYTMGIGWCINYMMKKVIDEKKGIFNLPKEAFTYPFHP
jgi:hypothetical protein